MPGRLDNIESSSQLRPAALLVRLVSRPPHLSTQLEVAHKLSKNKVSEKEPVIHNPKLSKLMLSAKIAFLPACLAPVSVAIQDLKTLEITKKIELPRMTNWTKLPSVYPKIFGGYFAIYYATFFTQVSTRKNGFAPSTGLLATTSVNYLLSLVMLSELKKIGGETSPALNLSFVSMQRAFLRDMFSVSSLFVSKVCEKNNIEGFSKEGVRAVSLLILQVPGSILQYGALNHNQSLLSIVKKNQWVSIYGPRLKRQFLPYFVCGKLLDFIDNKIS